MFDYPGTSYKGPGREVLAVYKQETRNLSRAQLRAMRDNTTTDPQILALRESILAAMEAEMVTLGDTNVSHHAIDPSLVNVIDLASSSFGTHEGDRFLCSLRSDGRVSNIRGPKKFSCKESVDVSFHIEIPQ